jgi:hypothetical protein
MLSPRLSNCPSCLDITSLIKEIDCKLTELAKNLYNNTVFSLNKKIQGEVILDLLNYKRILTYKLCNSKYANNYSVELIASRVKILIHK